MVNSKYGQNYIVKYFFFHKIKKEFQYKDSHKLSTKNSLVYAVDILLIFARLVSKPERYIGTLDTMFRPS